MSMVSMSVYEHLAELVESGFTVIEDLVSQDAIDRIRAETNQQLASLDPPPVEFDERLGVANAIAWSKDACDAVTHEKALAVIRGYLQTSDIHFGHNPVMTVLRPSKDLLGTFPDKGWHCDYPYHPDVFPQSRWSDQQVYGVQFNICIDSFRADNAATQYVPGSHLERQFVSEAFNLGGTRAGTHPHERVQHMLAPAGAALIYDARIWHRACVELNASGEDRLAILNAVNPSWVLPMADREAGKEAFLVSGMAQQLSPRVIKEITALCHTAPKPPPEGAPALTPKIRSPRLFSL
jgi:ectoine hydroxylase-related dioxygenase (phytanoyl-CoA dioxygenase family)